MYITRSSMHGVDGQYQDANPDYVETDPSGRYGRLGEVLGKGATKTVYKAIDEVLGMEVAWSQVNLNQLLLRSPDQELQRLYSEVHLLSTLNHHSIIHFYASWIDASRSTFNFITEMFTSGTLREYRKRYKRVDMQAIKSWARQILEGLVYLHGHTPPVIHRDIKCDNIFVNGHLSQVKIGDLGLAAILHHSHSAHSVIGTPEFMAPELYEEEYNELVDVYSFGMCVLEMLTSEYPYSECTNPAQIYKKVTSGKLPAAFYRIQDPEARRFIGKCLGPASGRLPAKDLLLDPFLLASVADEMKPLPTLLQNPLLNPRAGTEGPHFRDGDDHPPRTNMTITGKLDSPEHDAIFLKVQITDPQGSVRNIYFPFDVAVDTPLSVAAEMVKELDINDWDPVEIADMIDGEISTLIPQWNKKHDLPLCEPYHTLNYPEDDDGPYHPSFSVSSCSSSQASLSCCITNHKADGMTHGYDWLQDDIFDDTSSLSSLHSGKDFTLSSCSGSELESDIGVLKRDQHFIPTAPRRLCPQEYKSIERSMAQNRKTLIEAREAGRSKENWLRDKRLLRRNSSFVDIRSQLLHRSLVEEVNRRRLFRTVGAVEHIGFQSPCKVHGEASKPPSASGIGIKRGNTEQRYQKRV